ncbi:MAG: class I SAM-dependent methyltransferase [Dehalococcoidia bacterium]
MPTWNELYASGFTVTEPYPWVVQSRAALVAAGAHRVLDLGCGRGRHLVWLAREGLEAWGTDSSPIGVQGSRLWLEHESLPACVALADMRSLPFATAAFDAVISIHVLYHASRRGMQTALAAVARVLRPGGIFVATFLTTRAWKYGEGECLEPHTFVQMRGPEAGIPRHYCDEAEVRTLLTDFRVDRIHLDEFRDEAGDLQSHWEVLAARA